MPDEIAARATLLLLGGILAGGGLGALLSWLLRRGNGNGAASTWWGIAAGLAMFGAAMTWVATDIAGVALARSGDVLIPGTLLRFEPVKLSQSTTGRAKMGRAPVVEFTGPDGKTRQARGLAGSLQRREPGSPLMVQVDPRNPDSAVIADFQNLYAALWLFGGLCALAWLGVWFAAWSARSPAPAPAVGVPPPPAAHVTGKRLRAQLRQQAQAQALALAQAQVPSQGRAAAAPPTFEAWRRSDRGQHWQRQFARMGLATALLGVLAVFVLAEVMHLGRAVAITLASIAVALLCAAVSSVFKPGVPVARTLLGHSLGVLAMGLFAGLLWALTAD